MKLTLCGSARFEKEYHVWNKLLTLSGYVVYGLSTYPSVEKNKNWYDEDEKLTLDLIHLAKIEESDGIVVLNVDGYIGESTKKEIVWASLRDKQIFSLISLGDKRSELAINLLPPDLIRRGETSQ